MFFDPLLIPIIITNGFEAVSTLSKVGMKSNHYMHKLYNTTREETY